MDSQRVTIEEAEKENMVEIEGKMVPFGYCNRDWVILLNLMLPGDEIYRFCSSPESWEDQYGQEGYQLIRNGEIIADIITKMS
jgi:hypothetical protein